MKKLYSLFVLSLIAMVLTGCVTKKMVKQANELELSGMFKQAADLYYQAVINKPGKTEYRLALQRSSSMHLQEASQEIENAYSNGEYQKVVYDFLELQAFVNKVKATGIDISVDPEVRSIYNNSQNQFLENEYNTGLRLLGEERFDEAKTVFAEIFRLNADFKETRKHLNTATLEPVYRSGKEKFTARNYMGAWNDWKLVVDKDPTYRDTRDLMQQALEERYKEGSLALLNENFNVAQQALGDVFRANANYKEVKSLLSEAINEPKYRKAKADMNSGKCRTAYFAFTEILDYTQGNYRDASTLISRALNCAAYPVAIHTNSMPGNPADGTEFATVVTQSILAKNSPFVKVHNLSSIDQRISRSISGTTGQLNHSLLRALHDRHGIKAVLYIVYDQYSRNEGRPQRSEKTGFIRTPYTTDEGVNTHRDRMIKYNEYRAENAIEFTLRYQLISTETGEILLTQRLSKSEQSSVHYASYEGQSDNIYPATFINDNWVVDERGFSTLQGLLKAPRTVVPITKLKESIFNQFTKRIADDIAAYNPER